ncbi:hypothetical protein CBER1_01960 [Cercospora berteroae]|uniref:Amino acid permease/ SLC12A domain-containing protein n=1 Tax=Cercospora berteroae TaxID=357750 RepID=A0A2S6CMZ0_9PEZI|nr:hypothetical protein CBER1_01960 [Cercospora berteroae]
MGYDIQVKQPLDEAVEHDSTVQTGTMEDLKGDLDDNILRAQGHEAVLIRQFSWIAALGLGFSITNSWAGYLSCFGQNLHYGGPFSCIFGLILAFFAQGTVTTGLAELASAFPSSGGQYHFCYIIAPEKSRNFFGFVIGWMSVLAWWIVTCSGLSLIAVTISGIANFRYPSFVASQWQMYVIYLGACLITIVPVFAIPKKLSWATQFGLYCSILGCVAWLVVSSAMHQSTNSSALVQQNLGDSGWDGGFAFVLGIANSMYAYGGTDGVIHISEEIPRPGRKVPQLMVTTMLIGLLTSMPLFIVLNIFMTDVNAVRTSASPAIEILNQATCNRDVTTFLSVWLLIVFIASLPSQWIASGRIAWAFARDNGLPFSNFFSHIDTKLEFPVRTTIAALCFASLYGLLYLASTTAFNSIVTSAVLFLNVTYAVPQGLLLWQGRSKVLPSRYFDLGTFGLCCNIFAVVWTTFLVVIICFPPALPVAVGSMNYTSVVFVALGSMVLGLWVTLGKKKFQGPTIDWAALQTSNEMSK